MPKKMLIVLLIVSAFFMTACQPTPTSEIVQNKNDGKLQEKIEADALQNASYAFPNTWEETISQGAVTVEIDAELHVPDTSNFPVARIAKIELTEERIEEIAKGIGNDGKIYSFRDETFLTKSDVEKIILELKQSIGEYRQQFGADFDASEIENDIRMWEEYYPNAPEKFDVKEIPVKYEEDNTGRKSFVCGLKAGKPNMAQLKH